MKNYKGKELTNKHERAESKSYERKEKKDKMEAEYKKGRKKSC